VNGNDATGPLHVVSTYDAADPLAWRQWHHWNLVTQFFKVRLGKGKNVLTVHIGTNGNMNLAYFGFQMNSRMKWRDVPRGVNCRARESRTVLRN